ncbi:hypothetical protein ADK38_47505, partial [Streptomyces varsoviensis]
MSAAVSHVRAVSVTFSRVRGRPAAALVPPASPLPRALALSAVALLALAPAAAAQEAGQGLELSLI